MRVAIVGGGIYGAAIAYFLERFGEEDVLLFEKNSPGGISTSRSVGIVRHHYSHRRHIEIVDRARTILAELSSWIGNDGGFRNNRYLAVAGEGNEDAFRDIVRLQRQAGIDVSLLDPDELTRHLPAIAPEGITVGAVEHDAGFADPYRVATGFLKRAREMGCEVHSNTEVVALQTNGDAVTAVETPTDTYDVDYVVNAAGPFGGEVAAMAGIDLPISWHGATIAVLDPSSGARYTVEHPTLADMDSGLYTKPEPGGHFVAGGFAQTTIENPRNGSGTVTTDDLQKLQELLEIRLPEYADAEVVDTWTGVITDTPDGYQIIGPSNEFHNFYNAVAGNGHGFKEATALAESIAQSVLDTDPRFDLNPYRLERFEEDDEFVNRYSADWLG